MRPTRLLALCLTKTAAEVPFYEDPANIGAVAGATLAGGGAALLSKKNKLRNALIAALAGGAAGYVAGPHVDKAVPQIRQGLGALSGAGAKDVAKTAAASRADFDGNAVGTSPDFLEALGAKMAPRSATKPAVLPKAAPAPKVAPAKVVGKKTAQDAAPTTPFYKDPANIGAVTGAALAGGGAALLSKKNKWRNALIAALAGGTAGYFAGPHVDKAFPQIREGLGKAQDALTPATAPEKQPQAGNDVDLNKAGPEIFDAAHNINPMNMLLKPDPVGAPPVKLPTNDDLKAELAQLQRKSPGSATNGAVVPITPPAPPASATNGAIKSTPPVTATGPATK
jgi:outer membrane lipoprotein SlyB